jgi:hypothetical protein
MLKFEEATLNVIGILSGDPSWVENPGKIAVGTGLGYRIIKHDEPEYIIMHLQSGKRMPWTFSDEKLAQEVLEAIAPLFNWDRTEKELTSDPEYMPTTKKANQLVLEIAKQHGYTYEIFFDKLGHRQVAINKEK